MGAGEIKKAQIKNIITSEVIPVMFNPNQYTLNRNNKFSKTNVQGDQSQTLSFNNGESAELSVDLFFDCVYINNSKDSEDDKNKKKDVRKYTERIMKLLTLQKNGKPYLCEFSWGTFTFKGYISKVTQKFTYFDEKGIPTRAEVSLTFVEYKHKDKSKKDLKEYGAIADYDNFAGEQIYNVANYLLNDPGRWREVANDIGIQNPRTKILRKK